jgi:hypothetical protein
VTDYVLRVLLREEAGFSLSAALLLADRDEAAEAERPRVVAVVALPAPAELEVPRTLPLLLEADPFFGGEALVAAALVAAVLEAAAFLGAALEVLFALPAAVPVVDLRLAERPREAPALPAELVREGERPREAGFDAASPLSSASSSLPSCLAVRLRLAAVPALPAPLEADRLRLPSSSGLSLYASAESVPEPPREAGAPPYVLFTVAQAIRAAAVSSTPRLFSESSMCCAMRFCFEVYLSLDPAPDMLASCSRCCERTRETPRTSDKGLRTLPSSNGRMVPD